MFGEQDYAEGTPAQESTPETLEAKKEVWQTAHWESGHTQTATMTEAMKKAQRENEAALVYITALEQRVSDLEKVIKIVSEPETRPSPLEELGHVRGLDVLHYLDGAWKCDTNKNRHKSVIGYRHYQDNELEILHQLALRGYVSIDADTRNCWIREAGRDYLKALKHELRK